MENTVLLCEDDLESIYSAIYEAFTLKLDPKKTHIQLDGQESTDFTVTVVNTENAKAQVKVALKNVTIKNGKYKLQLQAPITYGNEKYATPFETEIVVTIKDTKPVATIKQTKKYNTLYKSNEGFGTFAITTKGDWTIEDITLENQSDTKKCDYVIQRNGDQILIGLKDGGDPKNTKGKLVITTNEYAEKTVVKNVTILLPGIQTEDFRWMIR